MDSGAVNGYGGSSPVPHLMSCEAEGQEYLGHLAVRQQNSVGWLGKGGSHHQPPPRCPAMAGSSCCTSKGSVLIGTMEELN